MDDNTFAKLTSGRVACREEILKGFDCVLIPKPLAKDLSQVRAGAFGGRHVKVRRHKNVKLHLIFGIIALFADQLLRLTL